MKSSVIVEMTTDEIKDKLTDEQDSLGKLRMHHAVSPIENPLLIRHKKKYIARLKTELNKRLRAENTK